MKDLYIEHKKKRKRKNPVKKLIGKLILLILIVLIVLLGRYVFGIVTSLSFFDIKEITIESPANISKEKILKYSGLSEGMGIYSFNSKDIKKKIKKDQWVKSVKISRKLPSKLNIIVNSKDVIALVKIKGNLYYLDDEGKVVDKLIMGYRDDLPIINANKEDYIKIIDYFKKLAVFGDISELTLENNLLTIYPSRTAMRIKLNTDSLQENIELVQEVLEDIENRIETATMIDATLPGNKIIVRGIRKK